MERGQNQINAGSMADIAFLLLIFFLVTTTMEVDAGIARNLPLSCDDCPPPPPVIKRNVLEIKINNNDELWVEESVSSIEELEEQIHEFYVTNKNGIENDRDMPKHQLRTVGICKTKIAEIDQQLQQNPNAFSLKSERDKWLLRLELCQLSPNGSFSEISTNSIVRIQSSHSSSYKTYIAVQNKIKKVVAELRQQYCEKLGWDDYYSLNDKVKEDAKKIRMLRLLVPERVIEPRVY